MAQLFTIEIARMFSNLRSVFAFNNWTKSQSSSTLSTSSCTYIDGTPDDVKNAKGLHLLTTNTPNGQKIQIFLEELHATYGTDFTFTLVELPKRTQKQEWFINLNPNGRVPLLVDNTGSSPLPIHETGAELWYLQNKFDKDNIYGFTDPTDQAELMTWLFFWHGSGAPAQANTLFFSKTAPGFQLATTRFRDDLLRLYGVLEMRLSGKYTGVQKEYLVGQGKGKYSIADIGAWPFVKNWRNIFSAEEVAEFPYLLAWVERIAERPASQLGTGRKYGGLQMGPHTGGKAVN